MQKLRQYCKNKQSTPLHFQKEHLALTKIQRRVVIYYKRIKEIVKPHIYVHGSLFLYTHKMNTKSLFHKFHLLKTSHSNQDSSLFFTPKHPQIVSYKLIRSHITSCVIPHPTSNGNIWQFEILFFVNCTKTSHKFDPISIVDVFYKLLE